MLLLYACTRYWTRSISVGRKKRFCSGSQHHVALPVFSVLQPDAVLPAQVDLQRAQVGRKRGISGSLLKGAYKTVSKIKPGFIRGVMNLLLDEWTAELEPHYTAFHSAGGEGSFGTYLLGRKDAVADSMIETEETMNELQFATSLSFADEVVPVLTEAIVEA